MFSDINECQKKNVCPKGSICKNSPGSFTCRCKDGFLPSGNTCIGLSDVFFKYLTLLEICNYSIFRKNYS